MVSGGKLQGALTRLWRSSVRIVSRLPAMHRLVLARSYVGHTKSDISRYPLSDRWKDPSLPEGTRVHQAAMDGKYPELGRPHVAQWQSLPGNDLTFDPRPPLLAADAPRGRVSIGGAAKLWVPL